MTTTPLSRRSAMRWYAASRSGVLLVLATLGALAVITFGASLVLGLRPLVVTTGSMEPDLPKGCVVVSRMVPAMQVQVGGIVTLQRLRGAGPVTSRVVKAAPQGEGAVAFVLRDDVADADDPEPYVASTAGAYVMQVPWVGYLAMFFGGPAGVPAGVVCVLLLVAVLVVDPARTARPRRVRTAREGSGQEPD